MGEVYRARDTRLGRDVALKVLPEAFARDAERMARFRREAQVLASFNHPNIAAIYGFEDSGSTHALVMELVEGPTLAERISGVPSAGGTPSAELKSASTGRVSATRGHRGGAIPLDEALPMAKQICEALEYAHERGIVHRDLKPANIKITNDDVVKVLDFGLAKALESDPATMDISSSPTVTRMATQAGIILGTAAYMSPEQAKGKSVDRRTDIWAFGCVLYEMLTGKMVFSGETVTDVLAAVIKSEPDWTLLPADTPPRIPELLQRCLKKDARQRLQSIGDARIAIEEVLSGATTQYEAATEGGVKPPLQTPAWKRILPWAITTALAFGLIASLFMFRAPAPQSSAMHFSAVTNFGGTQAQPALSPDGRSVAFVSDRDGHYNIYVGLVQEGNLVQISHDANLKSRPAWSPDGGTIAYAQINDSGIWDIWEVPALGGTPRRVILNAVDPAWSPDGHSLVYENTSDRSIWMSGISGENPHHFAKGVLGWRAGNMRFSPDGREIAFVELADGPYSELEVADVPSGKVRQLTRDAALALSPAWSPDSQYIYFASSRGGAMNIWKIPGAGGTPQQITTGQGDDAQLDVSSDGKRIVFSTWHENINIAQLDLKVKPGQQNMKLLAPDFVRGQLAPAYSPDGKHIAYFSNLKGTENESIWVANADGSNPVQLVRDGRIDVFPRWTPDSQGLAYRAFSIGTGDADAEYRGIPLSGVTPQTIVKAAGDLFVDVAPDGRLVYRNDKGQIEIFDPRTKKDEIHDLAHPSTLRVPVFWAPDGRSIAFVVDAGSENDPLAGLWTDDFKNPARQIFRGWVDSCAPGPSNQIYLIQGKADLQGVLWTVGWSGQGLARTSTTLPMLYSYWMQPQNSQDQTGVSPDGRYLAFDSETIHSANIGMIESVH